jgi:hypothetical protein
VSRPRPHLSPASSGALPRCVHRALQPGRDRIELSGCIRPMARPLWNRSLAPGAVGAMSSADSSTSTSGFHVIGVVVLEPDR